MLEGAKLIGAGAATIALAGAEPWQLGSQDAATPMMQGIMDLHHDIFFFLILILVFVLRILVRALWHFALYVIYHMVKPSHASSSSSSSSSSNNKRKDKRKEKEDSQRNLIVQEVDNYITKHKKKLLTEFPRAQSYMETTIFLNKVVAELFRDAGLLPTDRNPSMRLLNLVQRNLIDNLELVETEGYKNNTIYHCIRCLLKDYR